LDPLVVVEKKAGAIARGLIDIARQQTVILFSGLVDFKHPGHRKIPVLSGST
jgi:hypothetical protein